MKHITFILSVALLSSCTIFERQDSASVRSETAGNGEEAGSEIQELFVPAAEDEPEGESETVSTEPMELKGTIGEYAVTMNLIWPGRKSGPAGTYRYDSRPNSIFTLKYAEYGESDSDNLTWVEQNVVIEEYTAAGNMTGTFRGSIYNRAGCYTSFAGTFTNGSGKTFEFDLINKEGGYE